MWVVLAIMMAIVIIYVSYYYRYPTSTGLIQTSLKNFDWDMLLKRQPIIIDDPVQDIGALNNAWFHGKLQGHNSGNYTEWQSNRYKHLFIYAASEDHEVNEVFICGPRAALETNPTTGYMQPVNSEETSVIAIQLAPYQVMCVPLHWRVMLDKPESFWTLGYHDYITRFLPSQT